MAFLDIRARVDPRIPDHTSELRRRPRQARPSRRAGKARRRGRGCRVGVLVAGQHGQRVRVHERPCRLRAASSRRGDLAASVVCPEHARALGRDRLYTIARDADADTPRLPLQTRLRGVDAHAGARARPRDDSVDVPAPSGIRIVPLRDDLADAVWRVAQEADADVPTPDPLDTSSFERWHERNLGPRVLRELSFVALDGARRRRLRDARRGQARRRAALDDRGRAPRPAAGESRARSRRPRSQRRATPACASCAPRTTSPTPPCER